MSLKREPRLEKTSLSTYFTNCSSIQMILTATTVKVKMEVIVILMVVMTVVAWWWYCGGDCRCGALGDDDYYYYDCY